MGLVEYGVGITVCSVMVTIYLMISERRATIRPDEQLDEQLDGQLDGQQKEDL